MTGSLTPGHTGSVEQAQPAHKAKATCFRMLVGFLSAPMDPAKHRDLWETVTAQQLERKA